MGDNGWNLIYIDNGKDIHSPIYSMIVLVVGAFAILFLACITAIIYTYRNTKKDNRKILSLAEQDQLTGMDNLSKFQWETERLRGIMEQISGLAANFHKNYAITLYCGVAVEQEPQDREEQKTTPA